MVATEYREGRFERAPTRRIPAHRPDLALWRRRCVAWCLRRTVRRGWTRIPPPVPAERPLFSTGTLARIERVRARYPTPAGCARPRPQLREGSQTLWWEAAGRREF
jgi:hypothetical protein